MRLSRRSFVCGALMAQPSGLPALIIDGRHNHDWRATTAELQRLLTAAGFQVDVATAPESNQELPGFRPPLSKYRVVIPNYTDFGNGGGWSEEFRADFSRYVSGGGGLLIVHAASSAFPGWSQFNEMTGLGGWGGRDQRCGPLLHFKDGVIVRETTPGNAGHHGRQHSFTLTSRAPNHPVLAGMPASWLHCADELFDNLRGPARNLDLLATAWSDPANGGSGRHEPAIFTVTFGRGRVFHTVLGHSPEAMRCPGFGITLQRGAQWAATSPVTQRVPTGLNA